MVRVDKNGNGLLFLVKKCFSQNYASMPSIDTTPQNFFMHNPSNVTLLRYLVKVIVITVMK